MKPRNELVMMDFDCVDNWWRRWRLILSPRKLQRVDRTHNYEPDGFDGLDAPAMDASWALFRDLDMFPHRLWPVWPYGRIRFPYLHIVATTGRRSSFLHDAVASDTYGDLDSAAPTSRTPLQYSVCKVRATQVPQSSPQTRATGPQTRHRPVPMYPYRHRCQKALAQVTPYLQKAGGQIRQRRFGTEYSFVKKTA